MPLVLLILVLIAGAFFAGKNYSNLPISKTALTPVEQTQNSDETANWKTYTRKNVFEIKYPPHIKVWWEESNDSYIAFYREDVADPKKAQGANAGEIDRLCCGMSVYLKNPSRITELQSRPVEKITLGQYSAIRWTDNPTYKEDIWVESPYILVRFSINTSSELPQNQKEDFETYKKIISTFKFTN